MTYDIAHYWPLLLIALVIGGFVGGATWVEGHREGPLSRWMTGWMPAAALCFIIGLLLAVSHILRGRPGLWLETALLAFVFYVAGCFVGGWLRAIGLESQAALSSGTAGSMLFFRRGPGWIDREGRVAGRERAALDAHDQAVAVVEEKAAGRDTPPSAAAEASPVAVVADPPAPGGGTFFRSGPGWVDREGRLEGRERAALDDRERSLAAADGVKLGASGAGAPAPDRVGSMPSVASSAAQDAGASTGTVAPASSAGPDDRAAATPSAPSATTTETAVDTVASRSAEAAPASVPAPSVAASAATAGLAAAAKSTVGTAAKSGTAESPGSAATTPPTAVSTSSSGGESTPGGQAEGAPVAPSRAVDISPDPEAKSTGGAPPTSVAPSSRGAAAEVKSAPANLSASPAGVSPTAAPTAPAASPPGTATADGADGKDAMPVSGEASKTPTAQAAGSVKGAVGSGPAAARDAATSAEKAASVGSPPAETGSTKGRPASTAPASVPPVAVETAASEKRKAAAEPAPTTTTSAATPEAAEAASQTSSDGATSAATPSSAPRSRSGKPASDQASLFGDEAASTGEAKPPVPSALLSAAPVSASPASAVAPAAGASADPSAAHPGEKPAALDAARGGAADDLKLIKGIGPKNEAACNALGVYHFSQIADWSPQNAAWVGHHIAFPGRIEREHWVPQAKLLAMGIDTAHSAGIRSGAIQVDENADAPLSEAEAAAIHADMPALAAPVADEGKHAGARPLGFAAPQGGTADDLKRIKGIGKQNEARLHGLGIWHFDQIAAWSADNVKWVGSYLAFPGRITREQWISQAVDLAAGRETPFSKRVAAGLVKTSVDDGSKGQGNVGKVPPRAT